MVLVGDAAGFFDPLTGEGVFHALRSAQLAFGVLREALLLQGVVPTGAHLRRYAVELAAANRTRRLIQRAVEFVVARGALRRAAFRRLAANTGAADRLMRVIGDDVPATSLLHPEFLAALAVGRLRSDNETFPVSVSRRSKAR
jgi:flavin-dependent dehydrogenase